MAVLYGTSGVWSRTKEQRRMGSEPAAAFQRLPEAARLHPKRGGDRDSELPRADEAAPGAGRVVEAFAKSLIYDQRLEGRAEEYVRRHAAGMGDAEEAAPAVRAMFFASGTSSTCARAWTARASAGPPRRLHDCQTQVYGEPRGDALGRDPGRQHPDTSRLCGCRARDPAQHVNLLNEETLSHGRPQRQPARRRGYGR